MGATTAWDESAFSVRLVHWILGSRAALDAAAAMLSATAALDDGAHHLFIWFIRFRHVDD